MFASGRALPGSGGNTSRESSTPQRADADIVGLESLERDAAGFLDIRKQSSSHSRQAQSSKPPADQGAAGLASRPPARLLPTQSAHESAPLLSSAGSPPPQNLHPRFTHQLGAALPPHLQAAPGELAWRTQSLPQRQPAQLQPPEADQWGARSAGGASASPDDSAALAATARGGGAAAASSSAAERASLYLRDPSQLLRSVASMPPPDTKPPPRLGSRALQMLGLGRGGGKVGKQDRHEPKDAATLRSGGFPATRTALGNPREASSTYINAAALTASAHGDSSVSPRGDRSPAGRPDGSSLAAQNADAARDGPRAVAPSQASTRFAYVDASQLTQGPGRSPSSSTRLSRPPTDLGAAALRSAELSRGPTSPAPGSPRSGVPESAAPFLVRDLSGVQRSTRGVGSGIDQPPAAHGQPHLANERSTLVDPRHLVIRAPAESVPAGAKPLAGADPAGNGRRGSKYIDPRSVVLGAEMLDTASLLRPGGIDKRAVKFNVARSKAELLEIDESAGGLDLRQRAALARGLSANFDRRRSTADDVAEAQPSAGSSTFVDADRLVLRPDNSRSARSDVAVASPPPRVAVVPTPQLDASANTHGLQPRRLFAQTRAGKSMPGPDAFFDPSACSYAEYQAGAASQQRSARATAVLRVPSHPPADAADAAAGQSSKLIDPQELVMPPERSRGSPASDASRTAPFSAARPRNGGGSSPTPAAMLVDPADVVVHHHAADGAPPPGRLAQTSAAPHPTQPYTFVSPNDVVIQTGSPARQPSMHRQAARGSGCAVAESSRGELGGGSVEMSHADSDGGAGGHGSGRAHRERASADSEAPSEGRRRSSGSHRTGGGDGSHRAHGRRPRESPQEHSPHLARDRAHWFARQAAKGVITTAGPEPGGRRDSLDAVPEAHPGGMRRRTSTHSSESSDSGHTGRPLTYADKLYSNNDQTFHEAYWEHPPPPPASALHAGPYCYPRALQHCKHTRELADLDEFVNRPMGGQGVEKLIKARMAEDKSWGYEWIHTVLVAKGRSFPTLPGLVLVLWSILLTIICMVPLNFYQVRVGLETRTMDLFTTEYQRQLYAMAEGLEVPSALIGEAITFLLVFRVNTGYERWWEGRKAFRDIVNFSRNLSRQVAAHVTDFALAEKMMRWIIVAVYMLKTHVRQETNVDELRGVVSDEALNLLSKARNKPFLAAQRLSELVASAIASQDIHDDLIACFDLNISDLVSCIGTCDMILSTPMPFAYVAHLRTFILIWMAMLPPLLCVHVGWACIPCMILILVLFLGLDSISGEIENPFGYDWNDLPLDKILREVVLDIQQSTLMMLDMPLDQDPVTEIDLANFSVRAFGAEALLKCDQPPVRPVFPPDSLFLRRFRHVLGRTEDEDADANSEHRKDPHKGSSPLELLNLADERSGRGRGTLSASWGTQ